MNKEKYDIDFKNDINNNSTYISRKISMDNKKKLLDKNRFMIAASIISISLIIIIGLLLKHFSKNKTVEEELKINQPKKTIEEKDNELNSDVKKTTETSINNSYITEEKEKFLNKTNEKEEKNYINADNIKKSSSEDILKNKKEEINSFKTNKKTTETSEVILENKKIKEISKQNKNEKIKEFNFIENSPYNHYIIQINSSSNLEEIKKYADKKQINPYWINKTSKNGKPWYELIIGTFSSFKEAKKAIEKFPKEIKNNKPWIRQIQQIKSNKNK
ncbi:damX [Wigglesworthia glossinidia endosymbiont of Glossina brevipalpis]|uniref:DamX protein n=1 Tax=Wigglesworthia glossinidia brevipalpis TaxID=36870 RepID=Q8D1X7_WIGBR|nr:damX [Wigglesworthia glossinidia endosymbiont of Glossina brevipalpis]